MKRAAMTARDRESTILQLLLMRDALLSVSRHGSNARMLCPHVSRAMHQSVGWALDAIAPLDSLIEQVRALPVRDEQVALPEPREGEVTRDAH